MNYFHLQKPSLFTILFLAAITIKAEDLTDYGAVPPLAGPSGEPIGGAQKLNFHTDLSTGRFGYSVPIKIPPARGNSQPGIALQYGSGNGNGWCGVGWNLEMGFIERDTRSGVLLQANNSYSDAMGFAFSTAEYGGRLIQIGTNDYRPQINTAFLKFWYSNGWWTVTDKSGRKYLFGDTTASRVTNGYGTFRWALSGILDANGNKTAVQYTRNSGQLYLRQIDYNGNENSPPIAANCTVLFDLTNRTDVLSSLNSGSEIVTSNRLGSVRVYHAGQLVRRYQIQYANSLSTGRSLIEKIVEFGSDNITSLPAQTFSYSVQNRSFQSTNSWAIVPQNSDDASGYSPGTPDAQLVDINNDGLPDWVTRPAVSPYNHFNVQFNNGNGFGPVQSWSPVLNEANSLADHWNTLEGSYIDTLANACPVSLLIDINGDFLPDRVLRGDSAYDHFQVQLNTGTGFGPIQFWPGLENNTTYGDKWMNAPTYTSPDGESTHSMLTDMNGDGLADRVMIGSQHFDVQLNTTNNFFTSIISWNNVENNGGPYPYALRGRTFYHVHAELMDMNGDGLPDRVIPDSIQLNNGVNGFLSGRGWNFSGDPAHVDVSDGAYDQQMLDMNGDGLPDKVECAGDGTCTVKFNTGAGFSIVPVTWSGIHTGGDGTAGWNYLQSWNRYGTKVTFVDMNGDGLLDRVKRRYSGTSAHFLVQLNSGPFPDLLTGINNGIGGSVSIAYSPSTVYNNSDGVRPRLPFPIYTVTSVSTSDSHGNSGATTYEYLGGYYNITHRDFSGFAVVTETDPLGAYTRTWFHQGGGTNATALGEFNDSFSKARMPFRTEEYGSDDKLYSRTVHCVDEVKIHNSGVYFPFVRQTITQAFEGNPANAGYRAAAAGYAYQVSSNLFASTGNLLSETNYGEVLNVNPSSHTFTATTATAPCYKRFTYASVPSRPDILDRVQSATLYGDAAGSFVLQQTTNCYYETTGDLKSTHSMICPGSYASTSYTYDNYGNVLTTTSPVGIVSTVEYDANTATFPVRRYTGPLSANLVEHTQYDPRSGELSSSTNVQGLVTANSFDPLYRLTNSAISTVPNGAATLWRKRIQYNLGGFANNNSSNYVRTLSNEPADSANGSHESVTFFDGLGRPIQTRVESETNGQYRVSNRSYDERGCIVLEDYPVFATGAGYSKFTGTRTNAYTEYDKIGRPFRIHPFATVTFNSSGWWNGNNPAILTGDTGSPVGPTSVAFKEGSNPWAIVVTNALGNVHHYYLDAFGRTNQIVEITAQGNFTNRLDYDQLGNLTNIIDSTGHQISFFHDGLGRRVGLTDPTVGFWRYGLDAAGRLKTQTDAKGQRVQIYYDDPAGRVTRREAWDANGQLILTNLYTYDSNGGDGAYTVYPGQLFASTDSEGWQKNSYDVRGRVTKSVRFLAKNGMTYTSQYTYDDADRITATSYPNDGPTVTNLYDTAGNLAKVQRADEAGTNITYYVPQGFDEMGRLKGIQFGNGALTTFRYYRTSRRLNQIVTTIPGNIAVQHCTNRYDATGNIIGVQDNVASHTNGASGTITSASYDELNRLTAIAGPGYGTRNYSYDSGGNILTNGEAGNSRYTYYASRPHSVKTANGVRYAYDRNGNMIVRGNQRLSYDPENRLSFVATVTATTTFGYAGTGERLWAKSGTNGLQVWIGNLYEEQNGKPLYHVFADGKRICTFEQEAGNVSGYNPATQEFYFYHPDYLGSSSVLTERNGTEVQHYEYSAFGRDRYTNNIFAATVSHRYTGQILDEGTGLYYCHARYYDPQLGRFIQPDTLIGDLFNPQSYNHYSYCINNPLRFTDPNGQSWKDIGVCTAKTLDFTWNMGVAVFLTPSPENATAQQQEALARIAIDIYGSPFQKMGAYDSSKTATELPAQLSTPARDLVMVAAAASNKAPPPPIEPKPDTRESVFPRTTVIGENMKDRVIPFASRTANEYIPFGVSKDQWDSMTPKQRYKLNDGMLRMRINAGDTLVYIGRDSGNRPSTPGFDLTGAELLRAQDRNVQVNEIPPIVVNATIRNP
jgi:RHS repeat-associated protein